MSTEQNQETGVALRQLLPGRLVPATMAELTVAGVAVNSQLVNADYLFLALPGARNDGGDYISDAIARGAVAVLRQADDQHPTGSIEYCDAVPVLAVSDLSSQTSDIASRCYGNPSAQMKVIGVTGTNGKSTCVALISQLYQRTLGSAASIGTLGVIVDGEMTEDYGMTTPDAAVCQKTLAELRARGAELVAMEVSSHGLEQGRVTGIRFQAGVFTNLSHDHLDYHGSLENYAAAKQKLFETLGLKAAVINLDDPYASRMVAAAKQHTRIVSYSLLHFAADLHASEIQYTPTGVNFQLSTPWGSTRVFSPLLGEFNVYNLLAALASLCVSGCDLKALIQAVPELTSVPGRMQRVPGACDVSVVVDYAHTPDALAQAIAATRVHTSGRLWVVFGCGGDRDNSKRPVMAGIAERFADFVVVTSDNPRTEDPLAIIEQICAGFEGNAYTQEPDRRAAIEGAINRAQSGDVILIAGKGHETYQLIGEQKHPFDDVAVAVDALAQRAAKTQQQRPVS